MMMALFLVIIRITQGFQNTKASLTVLIQMWRELWICGASGLCCGGGRPPLSLSYPPGTLKIGLHPIYQPSRRTLDTVTVVPTLGILLTNWFQWSSLHPRLGSLVLPPLDRLDKRREGSSCSQRAELGQTPDFDGNVIKKASPSSAYIK